MLAILKTRNPRILVGLAGLWLVAAYIFISLAIDSGNFLEWLVGIFFVGWAFSEIVRAIYYGIKKK